MPSCREVDPLFLPYVDGEANAEERAIVEAHLRACPKCRHHTALQTAVKTAVREKLCAPAAPEALRARCRAAAHMSRGPLGIAPAAWRTFSMAAALVLVAGGVWLYSLSSVPTVLAAQLALDHVTCFAVRDSSAPIGVDAGEAQYARDYGESVHLPRAAVDGLELVNIGRCYCGEGAAAHAMYRWNGAPVSLYIIPDTNHARASAGAFGHDAVMWSKDGRTYVLLSGEPGGAVEKLAAAMENGL